MHAAPRYINKAGAEALPLPLLHSHDGSLLHYRQAFICVAGTMSTEYFFYDSGIQVPSPPLRL